jgi:hypothetical protein
MSRGRFNIGGDALPFTSPSFGLLSPVTTQLETASTNKWKMGIQWRAICPDSDGTFGECTTIDGDVLPAAKAETWDQETRGATPITVYSRTDCAPVGEWTDLSERNRQALLRSEERELERIFWTGVIEEGSTDVTAFPHLAATANVIDGDDLLQPAATVVTTIPQPIEVGVGMLEDAMRDCYPGVATLHVPIRLGSLMAEAVLLRQNGGSLFTTSAGSKVVLGNYPGTAPDGTATPGVTWIFATGNVFYQREPAPHTFRPAESFDRDVNTLSMIAERTYVIGWDCCLMAIPIQNGEDVTP